MERNTAEVSVKIYAVLCWIATALLIALGLLVLMVGNTLASFLVNEGIAIPAGLTTLVALMFGLLLIAFGVLYGATGFGLWRHRPWSRVMVLVLSIIGLLSIPVGTIVGIIGIWLFGFNSAVRGLFGGARPMTVTASGTAPAKKAPARKGAKKTPAKKSSRKKAARKSTRKRSSRKKN